jgi:hypothetical protein
MSATPLSTASDSALSRERSLTRGRVLQWLRTTHLWVGLWGAAIGLLFGLSGLLLNHRALLKIPVERTEVTNASVVYPGEFPNVDALADWLKDYAGLAGARANKRKEDGSTVQWRGQTVEQPERWSVNLSTPKVSVSAKHIPGSGVIEVETQSATAWGLLLRMHTGTGASVPWILLVDTIAGALIVLTLSGVLLWSKLRAPRLAGVAVLIAVPLLTTLYLSLLATTESGDRTFFRFFLSIHCSDASQLSDALCCIWPASQPKDPTSTVEEI